MTTTITIPEWANGPDGSGNGGWSAGLLAATLGDEAIRSGIAVSLRVPPPIGRPLRVERGADDRSARLLDDGHAGDDHRAADEDPVLVAEAALAEVSADVPDAVRAITPELAAASSAGFPFRDHHPFPRCVACGTAREPGQVALCLHCGPVAGVAVGDAPVFADEWRPRDDIADPDQPSFVSLAATWSALDCPSAAPVADPDAPNPIVLARLCARVMLRPRVDELHVLAAWHVSSDGRKHVTRSAMIDPAGTPIAVADALWIEVRPR